MDLASRGVSVDGRAAPSCYLCWLPLCPDVKKLATSVGDDVADHVIVRQSLCSCSLAEDDLVVQVGAAVASTPPADEPLDLRACLVRDIHFRRIWAWCSGVMACGELDEDFSTLSRASII